MTDTATGERMFPILYERGKTGPRSIPWAVAEKAYSVYVARFGSNQSLARLSERGGFWSEEMDEFYPAWREEIEPTEGK